jgi:exonuclease III
MKLVTWNVAGRTRDLGRQGAALARQEPDLVCLQEVRPSTVAHFVEVLAEAGLEHALDSSEFRNDRRLFNLTVSRWPMLELPAIGAPLPERVLSTLVDTPSGPLELYHVHIPSARNRGIVKLETCEALSERLARPSDRHRVLCGDLNLPRAETMEGEVITFAADHPELLERWDRGERSILPGLEEWGLRDVFRTLHGFERQDASWVLHTRARRKAGLRIDHILASAGLVASWCDYHHGWREEGLSDHSALEAVFEHAEQQPASHTHSKR